MASRTRWERRTGSSFLNSSPHCWRSACLPAMACSPTQSQSIQDTDLLGTSFLHIHLNTPLSPTPFWRWWQTQLIDKQWYILFLNNLIQNCTYLNKQHASCLPEMYYFNLVNLFCTVAVYCSSVPLKFKLALNLFDFTPFFFSHFCFRLLLERVTGEIIALLRSRGETWAGGTWLTVWPADGSLSLHPVSLWGRVGGGWWVWEGPLGNNVCLRD